MFHLQRIAVKSKTKSAAWLLSLLLLLVEAGALADELNHQLHKPDKPCAQCIFASHAGNAPVAVPIFFGACAPESHALPVSLPTPRRQRFHAYSGRAPPLHSEI